MAVIGIDFVAFGVQPIPMENYDLMSSPSGVPYRVHDVIADIFCVDVTDSQADKLLGLCTDWGNGIGNGKVVSFTDSVCHHFVGRGLPWSKETETEETEFWSSISAIKNRFIEFISA